MKSARITRAPIAIPAITPADKGWRLLACFPVAPIITVDVEVTNVDCPAFVICRVVTRVTVRPRPVTGFF